MDTSSDDLYSFLQGTELTPKPKSDIPISGTDDEVDEESSLRFDADGVAEELRHATEEELNQAPFGVIRLDDDGIVQFYNRYESDLSGIDPSDALGKNFFTHLAPCSNNRLFEGRFKNGVENDELDAQFTYTFTYKVRPMLVDVRLYRDEEGNNWILIHKR